jgi:hypothetical protein
MLKLFILFSIFNSSIAFSKTIPNATAECTIELEVRTSKIAQEPLKSTKKVKMVSEDGWCSERTKFDFTGTGLECEACFHGLDKGTYLNCWNPELTLGIQSDRSSITAKGEHERPNVLSVTKSKTSVSTIKFWCKSL